MLIVESDFVDITLESVGSKPSKEIGEKSKSKSTYLSIYL